MAVLDAFLFQFLSVTVAAAPGPAVRATSPMPAEHIDGLLAGRIQHTEVINILQRRTRFFGLFFALYCPEPIEQTQLKSGQ
jgi:hypothetical protein